MLQATSFSNKLVSAALMRFFYNGNCVHQRVGARSPVSPPSVHRTTLQLQLQTASFPFPAPLQGHFGFLVRPTLGPPRPQLRPTRGPYRSKKSWARVFVCSERHSAPMTNQQHHSVPPWGKISWLLSWHDMNYSLMCEWINLYCRISWVDTFLPCTWCEN